jgi:hypothetical protein
MGEPALERPWFFNGKLLTAEDLELEQEYFRKKLQRHNRSLHGFGVVSGLKVTVNAKQILVEEGMALDCEGNEIVIESRQTLTPPSATESWPTAYLNVRYAEESSEPVPIAELGETAIIKESFEIVFAQENCNRGHRHLRARWLACGKPHRFTLAKLRRSTQGWRIDRRYRPPSLK